MPTGVAPRGRQSANLADMRMQYFPTLRKLLLAGLLPALCLAARAQDDRDDAVQAAVADGVSGAAVFMSGALPVSPFVPILAVGMKAATIEYTSRLPQHERPAAYGAAKAMWAGGTVNNVCMTASFLTGGSFLPACLALGVAWGVQTWNDGERARQFHGDCTVLREFTYDPELACREAAPGQGTVAEVTRSTITAQDLTAP